MEPKIKQLYYYKWEGIEDVLQTIKNLYNQQQTAFKFNISFAYLLVSTVGNEYKYMSAQYNNRLFEFPKTIDNNKTLKEILTETEAKINNYKQIDQTQCGSFTSFYIVRYLYLDYSLLLVILLAYHYIFMRILIKRMS